MSLTLSSQSLLRTAQAVAFAGLFALGVACSMTGGIEASPAGETELPRIVAAGDFHGDYDAFESVITGAGLVDETGKWKAGDTIFIQLGDLPDRGPDTRQIITELRALQSEAEAAGGKVIVLVGNHEALLMTGDYRYLHPGEIEAYQTEESEAERARVWEQNRSSARILPVDRGSDAGVSEADFRAAWETRTPLGLVELAEAWSPNGEVGDWVDELPAVVVLGDSLFVHGGLSALYSGFTVDEINAAVAAALTAQTRDELAIINDPNGPMWYRELHRGPGEVMYFGALGPLTIEEELDMLLENFQVNRIVVGHTPSVKGIAVAHDKRVIRIDTGMSAAYGGVYSFLEIEDDVITAWNDGEETVIQPGPNGEMGDGATQ